MQNTNFYNLPSLTSSCNLRFGHFLDGAPSIWDFWAWIPLLKGGFSLENFDNVLVDFVGSVSPIFSSSLLQHFVISLYIGGRGDKKENV